jgi:hypothetical protein
MLLASFLITFSSCEKDEPEKNYSDPTVEFTTNPIVIFAGEQVTIEATLGNESGLQSFSIVQSDWDLDVKIDIPKDAEGDAPTSFILSYKFMVPSQLTKDSYQIEITANGPGSKSTSATLEANVSSIKKFYMLAHNLEGVDAIWTDISTALEMDATDNPNVFTKTVDFTATGGADDWGVIMAFVGQKSDVLPENLVLDWSKVDAKYKDTNWWWNDDVLDYDNGNYPGYLIFPNDETEITLALRSQDNAVKPNEDNYYGVDVLAFYDSPNTYTLTLDIQAKTLNIKRDGEVPVEDENVYIVGHGFPQHSQNWSPADGIEMTSLGNGKFIIEDLEFSNDVELKFVGQKSWSPDNYGWETKGSDYTATMINSQDSEPLDYENMAGIYKVEFDETNLTCVVTKTGAVAPPAIPEELFVIFGGFEGHEDSWYDPSKALAMTKNPDNSSEFSVDVTFKADDGNGWGVYFAFLGQNTSYNPQNYGINGDNITIADNNTYPLTESQEITDIDAQMSYVAYNDMAGDYTITVNFDDNTVKVNKKVPDNGMYLLAHNIANTDADWADLSTAINLATEDDNIYTATVEFVSEGPDFWGSVFAIIGQKDAVLPFNAVLDYSNVNSAYIDSGWWDGGDYSEGSNYPGYLVFPTDVNSIELPMLTQSDAQTPSWDSEPGFYNLHPTAFYDSPGTYLIEFNKTEMKLTLTKK